jgi:hypothetical protein
VKLDVDPKTILACLLALQVRAVEARIMGLSDSKWLRAYIELGEAVRDSRSYDSEESISLRH